MQIFAPKKKPPIDIVHSQTQTSASKESFPSKPNILIIKILFFYYLIKNFNIFNILFNL
jgi:hypothetical protein